MNAHQPDSAPIDIPETVPNPAYTPRPLPAPERAPTKVPEKVPEKQSRGSPRRNRVFETAYRREDAALPPQMAAASSWRDVSTSSVLANNIVNAATVGSGRLFQRR